MQRVLTCWAAVAVLSVLGGLQRAPAQDRVFCEDGDPNVECTDDSLQVVFPLFGTTGSSVYEYSEFVPGTRIDTGVVLDAVSERQGGGGAIQGWSYAVEHDPSYLRLDPTSVTTAGTVLDGLITNGFNSTEAVDGGWISGVVLSLQEDVVLPVGRHLVARASYALDADAGAAGTTIELTSESIGPKGSPPTDISISIDGRSLLPRMLRDGIVRRQAVSPEDCQNGKDDDGDGLIDLDDPDCFDCPCPPEPVQCDDFGLYFGPDTTVEVVDGTGAASMAVTGRNARPLLGFQFGVAIRPDGAGFNWTFSDGVGTDADRRIEILMTDEAGDSVRPRTPNRLVTDTDTVSGIQRGAALAGVEGDFLEFDLEPGIGGPGFFVGYVTDLDGDENKIPATGPGPDNGCPVNDLIRVELGVSECPGFAYWFGDEAVPGQADATGSSSFVLSSRNTSPLLGFQVGVRTTDGPEGTVYEVVDDIGTDEDRLIESVMTDAAGNTILPATPNTLLAATGEVLDIERGAALAGFEGGDFFEFDLEPGVGGPGFFAGYVSDLDGNENQIPATTGPECDLNELLRVQLADGGVVCPDFGLVFGNEATAQTAEAQGSSFVISGRNARPLLGFQLGATVTEEGDRFRYEFSGELGTDESRVVELLMTDDLGDSVTPVAVNDLLAASGSVVSVERGAAIQDFMGGDFLEFDTEPGVGGPGFFVGYVSDLDDNVNVIPPTAEPGKGSCPLNELLRVRTSGEFVCPDNGFAFGSEPVATVELGAGTEFSITGRSQAPLLGFQLGVAVRPDGEAFRYSFSGDLGTDENRLIELLMTDVDGNSIEATGANELVAASGTVADVRRGEVIAGFEGTDFFDFDTAPGIGGPGFFAGYVTDLDGNENVIPAASEDGCELLELLEVSLAAGGAQPFFRGDADGNGRVNVSDAVIIIQEVIMNFDERFDCDDRLDVDDDEELAVADALPLLGWLFQRGPDIGDPFFACEVDPTDDGPLGCVESNCVQ